MGLSLEEAAAAETAAEQAAEETAEETTVEEATETTEESQEEEATEESEETEQEATEETADPFFDELAKTGYDWRSKYPSKEAALDGIRNLVSALGQRNEDAKAAKALREKLGDDGFRKLLETEPEKKAKAEVELPESYEDMLILQQVAAQEQDSPERERARQILKVFQRRVYELARDPHRTLGESEQLKKLQAELDALKQHASETSTRSAEDRWVAMHRADLWNEEKEEWTPLGHKFNAILSSDPDVAAISDRERQLNAALRFAKAELPKPKGTRTVSKTAQHTKGKPRETDDLRTKEEQMKAAREGGMDDDTFWATFVAPGMKQ